MRSSAGKTLLLISVVALSACGERKVHPKDIIVVRCETGNGIVTHRIDTADWGFSTSKNGSTIKDIDDGGYYRYSPAVKCWRVKQ